jgi:NTP pyrophosphatase (non-canonical NTP hydrolase)
MKLKETQREVDQWIRQIGGYWDKFQILAQLTEELGEVAAALQREEGLRPRKAKVSVKEEVGDLLFTLAAFANVMEIDLEESFKRTLEKYKIRDAKAWKNKNESEN